MTVTLGSVTFTNSNNTIREVNQDGRVRTFATCETREDVALLMGALQTLAEFEDTHHGVLT